MELKDYSEFVVQDISEIRERINQYAAKETSIAYITEVIQNPYYENEYSYIPKPTIKLEFFQAPIKVFLGFIAQEMNITEAADFQYPKTTPVDAINAIYEKFKGRVPENLFEDMLARNIFGLYRDDFSIPTITFERTTPYR